MSSTNSIQIGQQETSFWGRLRLTLARRTEGRGVALLAVVLVVVAFTEPLVFTAYPVSLGRIALIGLVALGLTAVILMGELDLSVASTLALSGVVMAMIPDVALGVIAALAVGLVVGMINAFLVAIVESTPLSPPSVCCLPFAAWALCSRMKHPCGWRTQMRELPLVCHC